MAILSEIPVFVLSKSRNIFMLLIIQWVYTHNYYNRYNVIFSRIWQIYWTFSSSVIIKCKNLKIIIIIILNYCLSGKKLYSLLGRGMMKFNTKKYIKIFILCELQNKSFIFKVRSPCVGGRQIPSYYHFEYSCLYLFELFLIQIVFWIRTTLHKFVTWKIFWRVYWIPIFTYLPSS